MKYDAYYRHNKLVQPVQKERTRIIADVAEFRG